MCNVSPAIAAHVHAPAQDPAERFAERMIETLPSGNGVTIAGAGHSVAGDQPAAFCEAVVPFLIQRA